MNHEQEKKFFLQHVTKSEYESERGFYEVHTPFKAYKKARSKDWSALVWLTIPEKTIIYTLLLNQMETVNRNKLRCSQAYVDKITLGIWGDEESEQKINRAYASSKYATFGFKYETGKMAYPLPKFSYELEPCAAGIHCFLSIEDAKRWRLR